MFCLSFGVSFQSIWLQYLCYKVHGQCAICLILSPHLTNDPSLQSGNKTPCAHAYTNDHGLWYGNETTCVHAYKIRKCSTTQRLAVTNSFFDGGKFEAVKMLSVVESHYVVSISFMAHTLLHASCFLAF